MKKVYHLVFFICLIQSTCVWAQGSILSGYVQDEEEEFLVGAIVQVIGTNIGTSTDEKGFFELRLPEKADNIRLRISFVGYQALEISPSLSDKAPLQIRLKANPGLLKEVLVTAYGGAKKREEVVGSYEVLSDKQLRADRPIESFDKMMNGLIAGVQIEPSTEPGTPVQVRIRGQGSLVRVAGTDITSSAQPLFVLDGVPLYDISESNVYNTQFSDVTEQKLNPLASLNPEDIESITILKDAAASALYGANAANGVVLIKTKRGTSGKSRVQVGLNYGISQPINLMRFLNAEEYVLLYRETLFNSGLSPSLAGSADINTDWRNLVMQQGSTLSSDVSLSGGNQQSRYRISLGYFRQESISQRNGMERISVRSNIEHDFTERFRLDFNLGASFNRKESINTFGAATFQPNISPFADDGSFNETGPFVTRPNPLAVLAQNDFEHRGFASTGSLRLSYELLPNLSLSSTLGADYYQNRQNEYNSMRNASGRNQRGYNNRIDRNNLRWISFTQLNWRYTLQDKHHFSALAGFELQERFTSLLRAFGTNFPNDDLRNLSVVSNANSGVASSDFEEAQVSYYGQASYDYQNKYFLSLTARRDASSIFGGDVQNANFASVGIAWALHKEEWFKNLAWLSSLRLRGTYGATGNARIGTYSARGLYGFGVQYNGFGGSIPSTAPNPNLSWESNYKMNFGLDVAILNDRLSLVVEHYRNRIVGAISTINTPQESGFATMVANTSNMENWGWEATLNSINFRNNDFEWRSNFNFAFNRNRVLSTALERPPRSTEQSSGIIVGRDINTIYGVRVAGVDPYNGKQLWFLPNGSITDDARKANLVENRVPIGRRVPLFFGGFNNTFSYKGFTLDVLMRYSYGSHIILANDALTDGRQIGINNQSVNQLDRWQSPGDITDTPALHINNFPARNTTRFLFDNNYLAFGNVALSYRLPASLLKPMGFYNAFVALQATNLGYLYSSTSRADRNGIAEYRFIFPEARTFSLTFKATI
jgi:TonB-linked SusC/RagA family outer membrane protein